MSTSAPLSATAQSLPGRPRKRADCKHGLRPCPWVGCRWHLWADVTGGGQIKRTFPGLEPWEMQETCALDVADDGGHTLDEVAELVGLTRERVRQIEIVALVKVRAAGGGRRE